MKACLLPTGLHISGLKSALAGPFDLDAPGGEIICISGASGSGKSLFLRMIADLDPNEGSVVLNGRDRAAMPAHHWRASIPYVAAESGWWAATAADHVPPSGLAAAKALAQRLGVAATLFDSPVERLSTGERQRLALVRALVLDSPAVLLDEPTGPLDPASAQQVETVLAQRAAAGAVILMASHDPAQGERMKARRLIMSNRRLVDHA